MPTLSPQQFVHKWRHATLKERSASQEHFIDLCHLVGHPTPAEKDPTGQTFTFEAGATKTSGDHGWAAVWKKRYFAWEYKGKQTRLPSAPRPRTNRRSARPSHRWDRPRAHTETRRLAQPARRQPGRAKKRTLTSLYNQRPTWLDLAHHKLDHAVLDACRWPHDLTDEQILDRLLALNLKRAGAE